MEVTFWLKFAIVCVILYFIYQLPWVKNLRYRLKAYIVYLDMEVNTNQSQEFKDEKKALFSSMGDKPLKIVEVGIGTGLNFPYYPRGSEVYGIEPNPWFKDYIDRNLERCDHRLKLHLFEEAGEAMTSLQDESMDAVVLFYVLCSVNDVRQVMDESYRVLKPGGRIYYYQHVVDKRPWVRILQTISKPLIAMVLDCKVDGEYAGDIEKSGFTKIEEKRFDVRYNDPLIVFARHEAGVYRKMA